jgi:hypothetical protein
MVFDSDPEHPNIVAPYLSATTLLSAAPHVHAPPCMAMAPSKAAARLPAALSIVISAAPYLSVSPAYGCGAARASASAASPHVRCSATCTQRCVLVSYAGARRSFLRRREARGAQSSLGGGLWGAPQWTVGRSKAAWAADCGGARRSSTPRRASATGNRAHMAAALCLSAAQYIMMKAA